MVASGGTDLFLAGAKRILEPGACVGVHSWSDGFRDGQDAPKDAPIHQEYLDFYKAIGIDGAFYWYTLDVASADEMHWMSASEAKSFAMTTKPTKRLSTGEDCDFR